MTTQIHDIQSPWVNNPCVSPSLANTTFDYFDSPRGQIYYVVHHAAGPRRGAVLLCGPTGAERERAYSTLVKWGQILAQTGCDTMRFDYCGMGESTGRFENNDITSWKADAALCATQLAAISQDVPLVLLGARAGALIAAELFASGIGDALLLWSPPASGRDLLWDTLRRNLATQMIANPDAPRQTREQLVAALESGEQINVDGYFWSQNYWRNAQQHILSIPSDTEQRPWQVLHVKKFTPPSANTNTQSHEESVRADHFWEESSSLILPNSSELFDKSLSWLDSSVLLQEQSD